ncbi:hypothetical protein AB4Z50_35170 [Paenibacillus sp. 2TAB26]|uniref:hypothetical protein n=1 Tax=Paenibacillus sp. 2TAB26 TaxID=3233005 RepID=UPI003F95FD0C
MNHPCVPFSKSFETTTFPIASGDGGVGPPIAAAKVFKVSSFLMRIRPIAKASSSPLQALKPTLIPFSVAAAFTSAL